MAQDSPRRYSGRLVYDGRTRDGGIVKEKQVTLQAQVHCEDGMYWAEVPNHPGLFASGETLDELKEALVEAWFLYVDDSIASSHIEQVVSGSSKDAPSEQPTGRVDQLRLLVPA
jgi:predicted RNase H-like HicB family nuclease